MSIHPKMKARAAETKKVYNEKRGDKAFQAKSPKERFAEVSREVSKRLK